MICEAIEFALLYTINFISPRSMGFGAVRFGGATLDGRVVAVDPYLATSLERSGTDE